MSLAYALDQNSFFYWNILLILSLLTKSLAFSYLIHQYTSSRYLAIIASILIITYPADTMQLCFRSIHINWSLALGLVSVVCLHRSFFKKNITSLITSITASLICFAGSIMYDAAITLWFLPWILLWIKEDSFKNTLEHIKKNSMPFIFWILTPLWYIIYIIFTYKKIPVSDEKSLLGKLNFFQIINITITIAIPHALIGGWIDTVKIFLKELISYQYIFIFSFVMVLNLYIILMFYKKNPIFQKSRFNKNLILRIFLGGVIMLVIGYLPYAILPSHVAITQRTYLFATLGSVIVYLSILLGIDLINPVASRVIISILFILSFSSQLFQLHHYVALSKNQRFFLKQIIEQFDGNLNDKTLLIIDETHTSGHTWMLPNYDLHNILSYFYGHSIPPRIEVCHSNSMEWQRANKLNRKGTCIETKEGWIFRSFPISQTTEGKEPLSIPDSYLAHSQVFTIHVKALSFLENQTNALQKILKTTKHPEILKSRYEGILVQKPWLLSFQLFKDQILTDHYEWKFGNYWSLEVPIRGSGWTEAFWHVQKPFPYATAWTTRDQAQLYFDFKPEQNLYALQFDLNHWSSHLKREELQLKLNKSTLSLKWLSETTAQAILPNQSLFTGENCLEFYAPLEKHSQYGLLLKSVKIEPLNKTL